MYWKIQYYTFLWQRTKKFLPTTLKYSNVNTVSIFIKKKRYNLGTGNLQAIDFILTSISRNDEQFSVF